MAESNIVPRQDQGDTTTMSLYNDITVNGRKYVRGMKVTVPKAQADDIARLDYDANVKRMELIRQPKEFMSPVGINPLTGKSFSLSE